MSSSSTSAEKSCLSISSLHTARTDITTPDQCLEAVEKAVEDAEERDVSIHVDSDLSNARLLCQSGDVGQAASILARARETIDKCLPRK